MSRLKEIYRAGQLPVFQNRMFASEQSARACTCGDVVLVQDADSGLVYNRAFDPDLMVYDADYQNEQGHSAVFRQHLEAVSGLIVKHFNHETLIEVGCGKGHFLALLKGLGFAITGLDPTYEGADPAIIREYFTPAIGLRADGLILRHVLEHVRDPLAFLTQLRDANGGSGKIYIEVPCLDWIADHHAWFDVFYEHVNYFRLADFERIFGTVNDAGRIFGGQYLYAVADLASLRTGPLPATDAFAFPEGFLATVDNCASRLTRTGGVQRAAVWGGASKGVIFALFMERAGAKLDTIIDMNPAKQGKFIAATGLRVQSPEEALQHLAPGDTIFVMNKNYLAEIQDLTAHRFNYITIEHENI